MPEADKSTRRKGGGRARDGAAGPSTSPKPAAAKVTVAIGSDPSGADVCLASDHVVLGKTDFRWSTEKGARTVKLLVRKRGYRGQDFTVTTDRDATRQVKLYKLGADDIDDIENCKR
jgi:hypothetical protein